MVRAKTARQIAAAKRNLAKARAARRRGHNRRIDRRISRVNKRASRRKAQHIAKFQANSRQYAPGGDIFVNASGIKHYNKAVKIHNRSIRKTMRLNSKKR